MNINIRPLEVSDVSWLVNLRNDEEVLLNIHDPIMYPAHKTEQWLKNLPGSSMRWVAHRIAEGTIWGVIPPWQIALIRIDHFDTLNHNCYVGMDIDKEYRGKGLSKEIYKLVLDKLFQVYNMDTIYLEVLATNERAIHIYDKLGFVKTGCFPRKILRNDKYIDSNIMSLTKADYYEQSCTSNGRGGIHRVAPD